MHLLKSVDKMCKYKMDPASTEWTTFGLHTDVQMDRRYAKNTLLFKCKINHTESYTLGKTADTQYFPVINADENWTQAADWVMGKFCQPHYRYIIMSTMAFQITSLTIVYSTVYSGSDQRKHQSSASLAFVWGIHRWNGQ